MLYEIIDTPNDHKLTDLITWCQINSSKVLKITHGESQSYLSIDTLDRMIKTDKLINPLTNIDFPDNIKIIILDIIKNCELLSFISRLEENLESINLLAERLDIDIVLNRSYNIYESFIDYKLKFIDILVKIN